MVHCWSRIFEKCRPDSMSVGCTILTAVFFLYKIWSERADVIQPDIPNTSNREFDFLVPNQVWCGDITYIWAQGKCCAGSLHAPGGGLGVVGKAGRRSGYQGAGYGVRATRKALGPVVSLGSRVPVCEPFISPAAVALSHAPEHESPGKLLGQRANGERVPQLENGMDTDHGLQNGSRSPARYQSVLDASVQLGSTPSIQRWAGASSGRRKT